MRHLKSLGIDVSSASVVLIFLNENGEELGWEVTNNGKDKPKYEWYDEDKEIWASAYPQLFDAETGGYDHSYRAECGVFTLQNILDILPKVINNNTLTITFFADGICHIMYKHICGFRDNSPIESAYQMLLRCIENGYLKTK